MCWEVRLQLYSSGQSLDGCRSVVYKQKPTLSFQMQPHRVTLSYVVGADVASGCHILCSCSYKQPVTLATIDAIQFIHSFLPNKNYRALHHNFIHTVQSICMSMWIGYVFAFQMVALCRKENRKVVLVFLFIVQLVQLVQPSFLFCVTIARNAFCVNGSNA